MDIAPFRGIHYCREKVDVQRVFSPPYDIISPEEQEELYRRDPYNVVRLVLGKIYETDDERNNRYTRAAETFRKWMEEGVLVQDGMPAIYIYEEEYTIHGQHRRMRGFMARSRIYDYEEGVVLRHEHTLKGPKIDRLNLMRACGANFSQIFMLYPDKEKRIDAVLDSEADSRPPDFEVRDKNGDWHRMWILTDTEKIKEIVGMMEPLSVYIADGHHRYETSRNYRNEMREKYPDHTGEEAFNFNLVQFNNLYSEDITILPTYRLMYDLDKATPEAVKNEAEESFDWETAPFSSRKDDEMGLEASDRLKRMDDGGKKAFALYFASDPEHYHLLTLKSLDIADRLSPDKHETLRYLDVSLLHDVLIKPVFGIDQSNLENHIHYTPSPSEAISSVRGEKYQVSAFLNPTKLVELKEVSEAFQNMPQKSTYFYPKQITGLVFNRIDTDEGGRGSGIKNSHTAPS